jgi:hypothetical protein
MGAFMWLFINGGPVAHTHGALTILWLKFAAHRLMLGKQHRKDSYRMVSI